MERAAVLGRLSWQVADVVDIVHETASASSLVLQCPAWPGHAAGQHVDIRLTAEDGYQAQRSYSIASAPEDEHLVLTIQRVDDGEVSPYLLDVLQRGDQLELRGPIGGYFVWDVDRAGSLMLFAGGSGIVPLRAMLRHRAAAHSDVPARLLYSARALGDLIYREELDRLGAGDGVDIRYTLTREQPESWTGYTRRIDRELIADVAFPPGERPLAYVCGPTAFVETAASTLVELGHDPRLIRTERFGPSS